MASKAARANGVGMRLAKRSWIVDRGVMMVFFMAGIGLLAVSYWLLALGC
jgi:hypothetical protein